MTIEEWATKDFRIGIFPVLHLGKHEWTAGVRIGKEDKMTYNEALQEVLSFCENYKPKKKK